MNVWKQYGTAAVDVLLHVSFPTIGFTLHIFSLLVIPQVSLTILFLSGNIQKLNKIRWSEPGLSPSTSWYWYWSSRQKYNIRNTGSLLGLAGQRRVYKCNLHRHRRPLTAGARWGDNARMHSPDLCVTFWEQSNQVLGDWRAKMCPLG